MKLNQILAAALVAVSAVPAMARIDTPSLGNGELFLVIWDGVDKVSYTKDLGITMNAFNGSAPLSFNISDQYFTGFLGIAGATTPNFSDLKYAVLAGDAVGGLTGPKRLFTTLDSTPTPLSNQQLTNTQGFLNNYTNSQSASVNGNHGTDVAVNGSSYATAGQTDYFLPVGPSLIGGINWGNSNLVGTSAVFRSFSGPGAGGSQAVQKDFAGLWNVTQSNGAWTAAYSVAAVPEADGIVMALAGFGVLGFVSLRRRQD
jgi:hypothetical protein